MNKSCTVLAMINFSQSRHALVPFLVALAAAPTVSGCAKVRVPGGAQCAVSAENPHHSSGSPGWIVGKARFGCDASIDSNTNTVQIQQRRGRVWVVVAGNTQTQPRPRANKKYTNQANLTCRGGTFRTRTRGYGYFHGVKSGSTAWDYSGTVKNPCS